jgi:dihydroneopterin aldolase / 2-amino-4-hydroxy-6-hydroxymethyldihydropteridine diphosphokinase / dihydropteroate synthase
MALAVVRYLLTECHLRRATVRIDKPSALLLAQAASVEITRDRDAFLPATAAPNNSPSPLAATAAAAAAPQAHAAANNVAAPALTALHQAAPGQHCAYVALGANLGDRAGTIARALAMLEAEHGCVVADTAFLYETPAAYVRDQPPFLNSAAKIYTTLDPYALFRALQATEQALGRVPAAVRYGPRAIDLDLLFYDDWEHGDPALTVPHPRLHERAFVLRPLCDIAASHEHPTLQKTVEHLWRHLKDPYADGPLWRVLPWSAPAELVGSVWRWGERTRIMGIVNVTADSFTEVGRHLDPAAAVAHGCALVAQGADALDIGGMSSRPQAPDVAPDEEAARVVAVVRGLRDAGVRVPISVDTWRASVAAAALAAGASWINDISGGSRDPAMLPLMARAGVPLCLMHMRGNAATMTLPAAKQYDDNDVVAGVRHELEQRVAAALAAGVRRWNVVVDPGLGFAKTPTQSLELVRGLGAIVGGAAGGLARFPTLAGPSRKGFVGAVTDRPVGDRAWGTAAACAALVAAGVDVLRVHDVLAMADVARMGDAIWRGTQPPA